jgi:hypothetical protein
VKAAIPGVARGGLDAPRAGRITGSIRFLKRMDTETPAEVELHLIVDNKSALVLFVGVFPMVAIMPSGHQISAAIHHAVTENL